MRQSSCIYEIAEKNSTTLLKVTVSVHFSKTPKTKNDKNECSHDFVSVTHKV
jgi:hypothetical protein